MNITAALKRRSRLENLKVFQRNAEKTQVLTPNYKNPEAVKNRLTHSYEVKTSGELIAAFIAADFINVDYQHAIGNVCLMHDIGHPPFGHDGSRLLDRRMRELGLDEGFDDNSNNFVVIEKNAGHGAMSDYEKASLIKYPNRLYKKDKERLLIALDRSILQDVEYFEKNKIHINELPKRTLACQIMDEADRNSYVCSDLSDCYCIGIGNINEIEKLLDEKHFLSSSINEVLGGIYYSVKNKDITLIKDVFNRFKNMLNSNYYIGDNISLKNKNLELVELRESLYKIEKRIFIHSEYVRKQIDDGLKMFNDYIDYVLENEHYPSKTYAKMIKNSTGNEKYRFIRDMIAETTDKYVAKWWENEFNKQGRLDI